MARKKKKKKAAAKGTKTAASIGKADLGLVQEAYEDNLKKRLEVLFDTTDNPEGADARFIAGLKSLRDTRDRAIRMVQGNEVV